MLIGTALVALPCYATAEWWSRHLGLEALGGSSAAIPH